MKCVESLHVAVRLRCDFPSTVESERSVFDFGVANTFAQDSREHLLSRGRTRMLLARMSFMHTCLGKGVVVCRSEPAMKCVESLHVAVRLRCGFVPSSVENEHSVFYFGV